MHAGTTEADVGLRVDRVRAVAPTIEVGVEAGPGSEFEAELEPYVGAVDLVHDADGMDSQVGVATQHAVLKLPESLGFVLVGRHEGVVLLPALLEDCFIGEVFRP